MPARINAASNMSPAVSGGSWPPDSAWLGPSGPAGRSPTSSKSAPRRLRPLA